jgi:hypothetical protein
MKPISSSSIPVGGQHRVDVDVRRRRPPAAGGRDGVDAVDGGLMGLAAGPEPARRRGVAEEHHRLGVLGGRPGGVDQGGEALRVPAEQVGGGSALGLGGRGVVVGLAAQVRRRPPVHHALVDHQL